MVILVIATCVFFFVRCINTGDNHTNNRSHADGNNINFEQFAGSASCMTCHKDIYDKQIHSAHHLSSQPAYLKYVRGSFDPPNNKFDFGNNEVVVMEKQNDSLYQVEYINGVKKISKPFDIVVGFGTVGQSYLYWTDDHLYQLPISYFTSADKWSNSPGFPYAPTFDRAISARCLECHSTYINTISESLTGSDQFNKKEMIYGIECEKCHGPGAQHVSFQTNNPKETVGKYIINPAVFSRQQKLDMCALCHGGRMQKAKQSFTFVPGNNLADFFTINTYPPTLRDVDVHGNQYGLLRESRCFKMSQTLTCGTCHDVHKNEKGDIEIFSQRCQSCHSNGHEKECKLLKTAGNIIKTNCVDCHMPVKPSQMITASFQGSDKFTPALMRSHYIAVYPDETKKILAAMKGLQTN